MCIASLSPVQTSYHRQLIACFVATCKDGPTELLFFLNLRRVKLSNALEQARFQIWSYVFLPTNAVKDDIKRSREDSSILNCSLDCVCFPGVGHPVCKNQPK